MKQQDYVLQKLTRIFFIKLLTVVVGSSLAQSNTVAGSKQNDPRIQCDKTSLRGNGLCFTPNKGQIADMNGKLCPDVLYKGDGGGANIYLRKTGISYVYSNIGEVIHEVHEKVEDLIKAGKLTEADEHKMQDSLMQKESIKIHRVDMDFEGANKNIRTINEDEVDGYNNYYYAHCPQGITNVKQYNEVTYKNIYNGIDVTYYGNKQSGIKYDLIVKPHADPKQIKQYWKGAENIHINHEGNLVIKTSVNEFYESIPKVYQNINGKIVDVKARYVLNGVTVNFELGTWNPEFSIIIDPWATYYGGSGAERGIAIATDQVGNVVITGHTDSPGFPVLAGGYSQPYGTNSDAYVVKFDAAGNRQWATFYGGNQSDSGFSIATDNANNVVITGSTYGGTFPVLAAGGYSQAYGGNMDAFIVKFNAAGIRLWATLYGGSQYEYGSGIFTDNTDNIVISGPTQSATDFPILTPAFAYSQPYGGGNFDAFVVKFNASGVRTWATFFGGSHNDQGLSVSIDILNNVVITGKTQSVDFPVLAAGGYSQAFGGGVLFFGSYPADIFIAKFNSGGVLTWSTYYGGDESDAGFSITTDNTGNIIITGMTRSANFPVVSALQGSYGGNDDAFVVKFNSSCSLMWATFYGGSSWDWGCSVTTDGKNNIYLYMEIEDVVAPNLVDVCSYQPIFNGGSNTDIYNIFNGAPEDPQIVKISPSGVKICATYFGGAGEDDLDGCTNGIAIYGNSIYITGSTDGGFPVTTGAFQTAYAGPFAQFTVHQDVFVASLCASICEGKVLALDFTANTTSACSTNPVTFTPTISNSCDVTDYTYLWTFTGGIPSTSTAVNPTVTFAIAGTHDVELTVTTPCQTANLTKAAYITVTSCGGITANVSSATLCSGATPCPTLTATGASGTAPYTYLWSPGTGLSATTGSSVTACPTATTNYTVTVTDNTGTTATSTAVVTVNTSTTPTFNSVAAICAGTTLAALPTTSNNSITGTWNPALNNTATTTYTFTPTAGQCANTATLTIAVNTSVTPTFNSVAAICTGATLAALPTTSNNSITGTWSPALNNTATTTYTFTPTAGQCANTATLTIAVNTSTTPTFNSVAAICAGSILAALPTTSNNSITGIWSPALNNTATTTYTFTPTAGQCANTAILTIAINPELNVIATPTHMTCNGLSNGGAIANAGNGTGAYTYSWSNVVPGSGSQVSGLSAGIYTVIVTDAAGCTSTSTSTIISPPPIVGQFTKGTSNCTGCGCKEWILINTTGGTSPYSYSWPDGYDKRYKNQLCPGSYIVNIKDKNGCSMNINISTP